MNTPASPLPVLAVPATAHPFGSPKSVGELPTTTDQIQQLSGVRPGDPGDGQGNGIDDDAYRTYGSL
jgi:hypothetical protein